MSGPGSAARPRPVDRLTAADRAAIARHRAGRHRCAGYFSEGTDCIVVRLAAAIEAAQS